MSAVWTWFRVDLRSRWRSLAVLALLIALATSAVLAATAGARRGATAVERLLEDTRPATVAALPNEPGFDWEAVAALPSVESVGQFPISAYVVDGLPLDGGADFAYSAEVMDEIERPIVLEGRLADPTRDDEAVITKAFEATYGKGVGDGVTIRLFEPAQVDRAYEGDPGPPEGPVIQAHIVGVVRSPWFSDAGDTAGGRLIPSSALYERHRENLVGSGEVIYVNALVRLRGGAEAAPQFREELAELTGRSDIDFFNLYEDARHFHDVARFESSLLVAFALAALVAALFLVGQSVIRYVAGSTQDLQVLAAVGMRPKHVRIGSALGPALAAVVGAAAGAAAAVLLSDRFPMGTTEPLEPDPGRALDGTVVAAGLLLVPAVVVAGAVLASWHAARRVTVERPSVVAGLAARFGLPVPVSIGARFALERGRGAQAVPVLPALTGAVVGVIGVVAALTFADGVTDATTHPERFGQVADLQAFVGFNDQELVPAADLLPLLAEQPDVLAVNDSRQGVAESRSVAMAVYSLDPFDEPLPIVVTEGSFPGPGEVLLAPGTADAIGVEPGDAIEIEGTTSTATLTVSGLAFVPEGSHNDYNGGAWAPSSVYAEVIGEGFKFRTIDIALRPGVDPDEAAARIGAAVGEAVGDPAAAEELLAPVLPASRLGELKEIRRLPVMLAAFLALLAVAAVGHALATAVRRRRQDLAVLRALGVTRWQSRITVITQATLLAAFGVVAGAPLGFILGRTVWHWVADTTPLHHVPPVAAVALALVAPVALVVANLLAAWPSHRAASMRVAHVLRTE